MALLHLTSVDAPAIIVAMKKGGSSRNRPPKHPLSSLGGVPAAVTDSKGSLSFICINTGKNQVEFLESRKSAEAFGETLSGARFEKYLVAAGGNQERAICIYMSNAKLSMSLYLGVQIWEVALRNRLNDFLCWKFGYDWPFEEVRALRSFNRTDERRVREVVKQQRRRRVAGTVTTNHIVANLSCGFWVSLLTSGYEIPFVWRNNRPRIFRNNHQMSRQDAAVKCASILELRNRICHHEPIFHLNLVERHQYLQALIAAMCLTHSSYFDNSCNFSQQWKSHLEIPGLFFASTAP